LVLVEIPSQEVDGETCVQLFISFAIEMRVFETPMEKSIVADRSKWKDCDWRIRKEKSKAPRLSKLDKKYWKIVRKSCESQDCQRM
jgi:hypothetical protein